MTNASIIDLGARFYDVTPEPKKHPEMISIRDRATGRVFTILAPSGPDARFFLHALNHADQTIEDVPE